jgi:hypothetical protein
MLLLFDSRENLRDRSHVYFFFLNEEAYFEGDVCVFANIKIIG